MVGESANGAGTEGQSRRQGVQVIARAAQIMRLLAQEPHDLTPSAVALRIGLPRSTVHRILGALEAEGFVRIGSGGRLRLGPGLTSLALAGRRDLRHEAAPFLQRLSSELRETVDLAVLDGSEVLFVEQFAAPRRLRIVSEIGARFPAHCTANGKALLAMLPTAEIERLLPEELPALTEKTITSRARLLVELDEVRRSRVAYDREEHTFGMSAVGTVIEEAAGTLAAATVVMPTARFAGNEEKVRDALVRTRAEIEAVLRGGNPPVAAAEHAAGGPIPGPDDKGGEAAIARRGS
jgi:DNA-binding IclR family transcriptional regulator